MAAALTMLAIREGHSRLDCHSPSWAGEFFVTGIRQIAVSQGVVLAAEKLGKHKLVWQVITVIYFLTLQASAEPMLAFTRSWFEWPPFSPAIFGKFVVYFTAALTLVSGFSYFWKNRGLFSDA